MEQYTSKGQPFYERPKTRSAFNETATFKSLDNIEASHGVGTRLYFSFLIFLIIINSVLSVLSVVSWIVAITNSSHLSFFVSDYVSPINDSDWFVWNTVIFGLWFICGPVYLLWELYIYQERKHFNVGLEGYHLSSFLIGGSLTLVGLIIGGAVTQTMQTRNRD